MGKNPWLKKPKKPKQNKTKKKTGNNSLCQVDSFTKDAGSKEGSKIIFLRKIENTEAISTIKLYLETLKIKEMSKN